MDANDVGKFVPTWGILEILQANTPLLPVKLGNHCFHKACEDLEVFILALENTSGKLDAWCMLGTLEISSSTHFSKRYEGEQIHTAVSMISWTPIERAYMVVRALDKNW